MAEIIIAMRERIWSKELKTMRDIDETCNQVSSEKKLDMWELDWLKQEAYSAYIIHCEIEKIVPLSGY